nr:hypothetical protein [Tanacetum cinerariifolium]
GNPTFSLHKEIASPKVTHEFHDSKECKFLFEELPDIDSFNDIHLHFDDDPSSGSTNYSANSLLEEFADELALISYPLDYDDNRACDIESDIREIEFLLFQGEDSYYKDSIDQSVLTHCDDLFVDPTLEMFTDEQPPDYSFPSRFDVYPNDFLEIESDATFDDDSFDSEGRKSKRIISHEKSVLIITRFTQEKKLAVSFASWLFEDFDPSFSELFVFKEVPNSLRLLPFSSENEEKFLNQGFTLLRSFIAVFSLNYLIQPGHLAAMLGCAETKVATWDDLAFKLMHFGLNVEHLNVFCKTVDLKLKFRI